MKYNNNENGMFAGMNGEAVITNRKCPYCNEFKVYGIGLTNKFICRKCKATW